MLMMVSISSNRSARLLANRSTALYGQLVAQAYAPGSALNAAHVFEVDDVIDPADTRRWLLVGLRSAPPPLPRDGKKRPCIDTW